MESAQHQNKHLTRKTFWKLLPCLILMFAGLGVTMIYGGVKNNSTQHTLIDIAGVLVFVLFAFLFLNILSKAIRTAIIDHKLGTGRALAAQFVLKFVGYIVILFTALDHLGIAVGHLLLGSAILGIVLGVAAQQALSNVFASIVLIVSHPFAVGQEVSIISGGLGGKYEGKVIEIGVTHTRIKEKEGTTISLPNTALLTNASIRIEKAD